MTPVGDVHPVHSLRRSAYNPDAAFSRPNSFNPHLTPRVSTQTHRDIERLLGSTDIRKVAVKCSRCAASSKSCESQSRTFAALTQAYHCALWCDPRV